MKAIFWVFLYGLLPFLAFSALRWRSKARQWLPGFEVFVKAWKNLSFGKRFRLWIATYFPVLCLLLAIASWSCGLWIAKPVARWKPLPVKERRIVLVNDLSASMQGTGEERLRQAVLAFLNTLLHDPNRENVRLGVVEFSGTAKVLLPLVKIADSSGITSEIRKKRLIELLSSMGTSDPAMGDGTELGEGLWAGLELIVRYGRRNDPLLSERWQRLKQTLLRSSLSQPAVEQLRDQLGTHADSVLVAFTDGFVEGEKLSSAAVFSVAKALGVRTYFLSVEAVPDVLAHSVDRAIGHLSVENVATLETLYREIASREARPSSRRSLETDVTQRKQAVWLGLAFFFLGMGYRWRKGVYVP
ncbi:vWA domain-containing protein [Candidatus Methylacidithermus pantelleriae]|uniref:VWFA domain-containing protein n=1 Tax=Candidatus Methylacidithermus pantelleriae TaxID=2744239 RepID=A0A8J2FSF4_9BACT|nr:vWA domain-containing protein [Candidatus Methylacidithermus pantelleriae]CAF0698432.1 hypothetical protein MPNT_270015 [Candidatus Methylacidithermus pantelleriae]